MVPGVPSGDRGNWGKNRNVTENPFIFCEECLRKITAKDVEIFRNGAVDEFYRLKALITLERVST